MFDLLCTRKRSLKNLIRSWKSPRILFLHGSMNPDYVVLTGILNPCPAMPVYIQLQAEFKLNNMSLKVII